MKTETDFKILVVNHSAELPDLTTNIFKKAGYKVYSASNGSECQHVLHNVRPDLVILDETLPDIDGKDLCKRIKSNPEFSSIYIILLFSKETTPADISDSLGGEADGYLLKPVNNRELVSNLEAARRIINAEKALHTSEQKWQITFNSIKDSIFILNEEGIIIQTNLRSTELLGKTEAELLGQHCYTIVHCSSGHIDDCPFLRMKKSKKRETMLLPVDDKWFIVTVDPLFDDSNNFQGAVHFISDITEQKLADDKTKSDKIILKACIDSPNDMIVLAIDRQFKYLAFNTFHKNVMLHAYDSEVEPGMNLIGCMKGEEDIAKAKVNYSRAMDGESHITIEEFGDIDRQYYETRYNPILNEENEIIGATAFAFNVTERIKLQEALRENERLLKESQAVAGLGTYIWDLSTGLWRSSEILDKIFGIDSSYVRSFEGWVKIIHPEWQKIMSLYVKNEVVGKNTKFDKEYQIIRQTDGEIRWVHGLGELELDDEKNPNKLIGTIVDITERRLSGENLKESESLYKKMVENSPMGMHFYELNNKNELKFIGSNKASDIILNTDNSRFIGKTIEEAFPSLVQTEVPQRYAEAAEKGIVWSTEQILYSDNRITGAFEVKAFQTNPRKMVAVFSDISKRKLAEITLKKSEEKYRLLAENISDVIWILDPETMRFLYISPSVERLRGHTSEEILSQPISKSVLEASVDDIVTSTHHRAQAFLSGSEPPDKYYIDEIWQPHKNGTIILTEVITSYYINTENGRVEILGVTRDITARKKAEEEIKKLNAELEQRIAERTSQLVTSNKELQAFAYSVSHDLRAPLRAIDGFSKFVLEGYGQNLDYEGKRLLEMIRNNTIKMDQLITDLLALSRVSRSDLKVSLIDMTKMSVSMLNEVAPNEIQAKIDLIVDTMPEIYGDPTYIKQVWINLISNAIKFSSNKRKPKIEIGGYTENDFNVYYIKDNGVGFDPDYTDKLFEAFQRLHKSDEFEGNGVGLAIVQRIIFRHGGKVWAEGKVNKGAIFYFSLPIKKVN